MKKKKKVTSRVDEMCGKICLLPFAVWELKMDVCYFLVTMYLLCCVDDKEACVKIAPGNIFGK